MNACPLDAEHAHRDSRDEKRKGFLSPLSLFDRAVMSEQDQPLPAAPVKDPISWLYPEIEPSRTGSLPVSPMHTMYFEECGNPRGTPVFVLHGGPGGGSDAFYRRFFDPLRYRVILHDQRGAGKSTPHATLEDNTTWKLIEDIEKLREHLGIEKMHVFGGSWGSTLSLAYAETHPDRVLSLVLRGIFLLRRKEIEWFYEGKGANHIFADAWEDYVAPIPEAERGNFVEAYYKRLTSDDEAVRSEAARAWSVWEGATSKIFTNPENLERFEDPK